MIFLMVDYRDKERPSNVVQPTSASAKIVGKWGKEYDDECKMLNWWTTPWITIPSYGVDAYIYLYVLLLEKALKAWLLMVLSF